MTPRSLLTLLGVACAGVPHAGVLAADIPQGIAPEDGCSGTRGSIDDADASSLLQVSDPTRMSFTAATAEAHGSDSADKPPCHHGHFPGPRPESENRATVLMSVWSTMELGATFTVSGTHFAQGYTTEDATTVNVEGMKEDCDNINMNMKLSTSFRNDVFSPGLKGFFFKCEKIGDKNKYWFTISGTDIASMVKLCDSGTEYPIVYDEQHNTYWRDLPFTCEGSPVYSTSYLQNPFLASVWQQLGASQLLAPSPPLSGHTPREDWPISGTHFAQGYTTEDATAVNVRGMEADCDNINSNKRLTSNFRGDLFSPSLVAFSYACQRVGNRNKYWFTISAGSLEDLKKLCDKSTRYPIVYDRQYDTYWRVGPFYCNGL